MRIGHGLWSALVRAAGIFKIVTAASLLVFLSAENGRAGDITAQPGNGVNVTNSVTNLMPQGAPPPGWSHGTVCACPWRHG